MNPWHYWPMSITMWAQFAGIGVGSVWACIRAVRERKINLTHGESQAERNINHDGHA